MPDKQTLDVYAGKARDYATCFAGSETSKHVKAFVEALPQGGCVLDLGCGPADAAAAMLKSGLNVDAWDASPEMADIARELFEIDVRIATFEELNAVDHYDGIYANFSLLHSPKREMPEHLARISAALKPGGIFHIGMKTGSGERRDKLGRFYAFYAEHELEDLLSEAGLSVTTSTTGEETGLDGTVSPWVIMQARK